MDDEDQTGIPRDASIVLAARRGPDFYGIVSVSTNSGPACQPIVAVGVSLMA